MAESFLEIGIPSEINEILKKNGISKPTPVQERVVPMLLEGKDVMVQSQTGTGKTLSFLLPMLKNIDKQGTFIQALIITPTRELAIQIASEAKKYGEPLGIDTLKIYGGQDAERQIKKLKGTPHIVVGTPGRLLEHVKRKTVDFHHVKTLVLDEADEIINMGFLEDVEGILGKTSKSRQTTLFSATIPASVHAIGKRYMKTPSEVNVKGSNLTLDEINQLLVETLEEYKQKALLEVVKEMKPYLGIVFCKTKKRVMQVNEFLIQNGVSSDELHGDLTQAKREQVMKKFRKAELEILVATDIAARGLDIEGITHVFSFDAPHSVDNYIHRIGRTGRAGQSGCAVTFITAKDKYYINQIQKAIAMKLNKKIMKPESDSNFEVHEEIMDQKQIDREKPQEKVKAKRTRNKIVNYIPEKYRKKNRKEEGTKRPKKKR